MLQKAKQNKNMVCLKRLLNVFVPNIDSTPRTINNNNNNFPSGKLIHLNHCNLVHSMVESERAYFFLVLRIPSGCFETC